MKQNEVLRRLNRKHDRELEAQRTQELEARKNKVKAGKPDKAVTNVTALTSLLTLPARVEGFRALDCNNASNPVENYSLLEPGPCPNVMRTYQLERTLEGKIVK